MSKRRYRYTVTDIDQLAAAFPKAVTEEIIPERVERKVNYVIVSKLLDCKVAVPGIVVAEGVEPPAIIGGKADRL